MPLVCSISLSKVVLIKCSVDATLELGLIIFFINKGHELATEDEINHHKKTNFFIITFSYPIKWLCNL